MSLFLFHITLQVLWDEEEGIWLDYDLENDINRDYFYMSNFTPLWTKSYTFHPDDITKNVVNYMVKYNLDRYTGEFIYISSLKR